MVMGSGESSALCAHLYAVPAISKHENCRVSASKSAASRTTNVFRGLPKSGSCLVTNGSRKRVLAIRAAKSGSVDVPESPASTSSSIGSQAQSHLNLLEQMTQNSTAKAPGNDVKTIREQLSSQIEQETEEVDVPLANVEKEAQVKELTVSQKRNIRRQAYMDKVSERNDVPFFATLAGFVLVPPIIILGFAVATGYVEFFP